MTDLALSLLLTAAFLYALSFVMRDAVEGERSTVAGHDTGPERSDR